MLSSAVIVTLTELLPTTKLVAPVTAPTTAFESVAEARTETDVVRLATVIEPLSATLLPSTVKDLSDLSEDKAGTTTVTV